VAFGRHHHQHRHNFHCQYGPLRRRHQAREQHLGRAAPQASSCIAPTWALDHVAAPADLSIFRFLDRPVTDSTNNIVVAAAFPLLLSSSSSTATGAATATATVNETDVEADCQDLADDQDCYGVPDDQDYCDLLDDMNKRRDAPGATGGQSSSKKRKVDSGPKFYAVKAGFRPGVYEDYADCQAQTSGFKGALCMWPPLPQA
jgi:hypothetical protein